MLVNKSHISVFRKLLWHLSLIVLVSCNHKETVSEFSPSKDVIGYRYNYYKNCEKIEYIAHLGLIRAGAISITVDTNLHPIKSITCYKTVFEGKAIGTLDWFNNLSEKFTSYVDTASKLPQLFIRDIHENKFKKLEYSYFYHSKSKVVVKELQTSKADSIKEFAISNKMEDLISSYFLLRNVDFNNLKYNDSLSIDVFLENKSYNFKFKYLRKEIIKTKIGKFDCIVLAPKMPSNDFLRTANPIQVWLSNDDKRIPLKVKAKILAGSLEIDITNYKSRR